MMPLAGHPRHQGVEGDGKAPKSAQLLRKLLLQSKAPDDAHAFARFVGFIWCLNWDAGSLKAPLAPCIEP